MRTDLGPEVTFAPERLLESCDDDADLAREVLLDFRESAPIRMSRLASAIAELDTSLVRLEAHSIKGSSKTIGAEALAAAASYLEEAGKEGDLSDARRMLVEAESRLNDLILALTSYLEVDSN